MTCTAMIKSVWISFKHYIVKQFQEYFSVGEVSIASLNELFYVIRCSFQRNSLLENE